MLDLFLTRADGRLHPTLYRATLGAFALVSTWEAGHLVGPARGRALEQAFYRLCRFTGLRLTEQAGSRTLRSVGSASGLSHESDAVIVAADITVHVEMKSLFGEVPKHDLMLFNQKGMDFILADAPELRSRPCYRLFLTTSPVTPEARRFAAIWGIGFVERERLPLAVLHWLAGSDLKPAIPPVIDRNRAWREIPKLLMPLQQQLQRLGTVVASGGGCSIGHGQIEAMLTDLQTIDGPTYWAVLDRMDPFWLEGIYEEFVRPRMLHCSGAPGSTGAAASR